MKPPAMARFPRGHAAKMPWPPLRGRTVSLVRTYSTAANPDAPCGPGAPRGPWGPRTTVTRGVTVGGRRAGSGVRAGCGAATTKPTSATTAPTATTIYGGSAMVYRYWIRRTALVVGPILLTLATGVAPVVAAGPRVLMVYGPPLAKPIILHNCVLGKDMLHTS